MRVFVTGGTGFVGRAVVADLLDAGHDVSALARSDRSADLLSAAGARPRRGSLEDLDGLRADVERADAVIHTAFNNADLLHFRRSSRIERDALRTIAAVLDGRPMVAAAGFAPVVASGPAMTEADPCSPRRGLTGRNVELTIMRLAEAGANASVVRLPCVHGDGDHFTIPRFIDVARRRGVSAFVGDGTNRWPAVHNVDAARVFRLAVERAVPGARYHAVAEEGVEYRRIAEVIGRRLRLPVAGISPRRARGHFGLLAGYASSDGPASSEPTRAQLGWIPRGLALLADLDRPEYFDA